MLDWCDAVSCGASGRAGARLREATQRRTRHRQSEAITECLKVKNEPIAACVSESENTAELGLLNEYRMLDRSLDESKWEQGRIVCDWTKKWSRGRGDADFAKMVGSTRQTVNYRRLCWEKFATDKEICPLGGKLSWAHFKAALAWPDATKWLKQAATRGLSVDEMESQRGGKPHVTNNSGEVEWYTPPDIIEAAREVLGEIDLDPASCKKAQAIVRAREFFTIDDDGLSRDWSGRVWLNPPYSAGLVSKFTDKLLEHVAAGDIRASIVLVNNCTDTAWFQLLASSAAAICFTAGRIKFLSDDMQASKSPLQGQAIVYHGGRAAAFRKRFSAIGLVMEAAK